MEQRPPSIALEQVVADIVRHDARDPHLLPDERVVFDFNAVPAPGDVVLVQRNGRYRIEVVQSRPLRIGADYVIAVLRFASVGVVVAATLMHACGALVD